MLVGRGGEIIKISFIISSYYNFTNTPLYFVRSGYVNVENGRLWNGASYGYVWSSKVSSSVADSNVFYLRFSDVIVEPSRGPYPRSNSYPLRCLGDV